MVFFTPVMVCHLLTVFTGHNDNTHLVHINGNGINGSSLPYLNGSKTNGNIPSINGAGIKEADYIETGGEVINGHLAVPWRHLFVWSSHDQGKYNSISSGFLVECKLHIFFLLMICC